MWIQTADGGLANLSSADWIGAEQDTFDHGPDKIHAVATYNPTRLKLFTGTREQVDRFIDIVRKALCAHDFSPEAK